MAHTHAHTAEDLPPAPPRARRLLVLLLVPLGVATLAGVIALWPGEVRPDLDPSQFGGSDELIDARIVEVERGPCPDTPPEADITCATPTLELLSGPDEGELVTIQPQSEVGGLTFEPGDTVILSYQANAGPGFEYAFSDVERKTPLFVLVALFAVAVVLLGRLQGLRALLGLVLSFAVLVYFVLPAVLDGRNPLAVALVGSSLIAFVSLYLAHGLHARTSTALLGSLASLGLVGILSAVFVAATRLSGLADEEAMFLTISVVEIDMAGLLLAGFVIGTLGVLDDVTITQASAVWELHAANPRYSRWELYRSALRIGRDHIASTVNTLVLAYAGAALPLFLIFHQGDLGLLNILNGEVVAVEIVRTLCGSIGLVASVPLTTALAALVVVGPSRPSSTADAPDEERSEPGADADGDGHGAEPAGRAARAVADGPPRRQGRSAVPGRDSEPPADPRTFRSRRERRFWEET